MEYNLVLNEVEGKEEQESRRKFLGLILGLGSASTKLQMHGSSPTSSASIIMFFLLFIFAACPTGGGQ
ncbi:Hypothetical predicted protein, partial [Olea europaea subsp. europaea]